MKVLFVLDSLFGGGTERSTVVLLPYLRDRGIEPTVAVLRASKSGDEAALTTSGIEVVVLEGSSKRQQIAALRALIGCMHPDIVHTALFAADVVGRLAAWRTGALVVSSLVNTPYDRARLGDPNVRRWKLRTVQIIDAVTARLFTHRLHAVSTGVAEANRAALHYPASRITTVERGRSRDGLGHWSTERRLRVRRELGLAENGPVVLAAGRHEFQKAQVDLVLAAELLLPEVADLCVLIAGPEGNASAVLHQALDERPALSNVVRVLGHRDDVADLMVAADVLVVSSHWEGTAGAALEALALRCPVVSTDLIGLRGILTADRTASLVPIADPTRLADAMRRVLTEEGLADRLRDVGEADYEARFTLDKSADGFVAMYREMLGGRT